MTEFNNLPELVEEWNLSTSFIVRSGCFETVEEIPFKASVSVLLGTEIRKEHISVFADLAEKSKLKTVLVSTFRESGVTGVIFVHDHFDNDFSHALKFADWSIDGLHVGSLPDPHTPGVILLDMDATCVQCECIDEMAKLAGIGDQVSAVTAQAMQGHMEFQESFRRRIALFNGKSESVMDVVEENLPVMPGFAEMVSKAKSCGWHVAIASGGFTRFVGKLKREYGLDYVVANNIEAIDGVFTGKVLGQIVDSKVKADTLLMLKDKYGLPVRNTMAVGDGANDLPMIGLAGTGVAIHAKPVVKDKAPISISRLNLHAVAALLEAGLILSEKL